MQMMEFLNAFEARFESIYHHLENLLLKMDVFHFEVKKWNLDTCLLSFVSHQKVAF